MASLKAKKIKGGVTYSVIFYLNKERRTLFLGSRYSASWAEEVRMNVERLVETIETGSPVRRSLTGWLDECGEDLLGRLEKAGLIEQTKKVSNAQLWEEYLDDAERSSKVKESTIKTYRTVMRRFLSYFDPTGEPADITAISGEKWRAAQREHLADATIAGSIQRTRTVFDFAVQRGYIGENVFKRVERGSFENKDKEFFITRKSYGMLLDACPDQTWRTILALCRIGGLRNPSETLLLEWRHVNWEKNLIQVQSPKTKRYRGHESRLIPLWPELREELAKQFDQAEPGGSPYVISNCRSTATNLRTRFLEIIFFAGLEPWPRPFHNLRGSRSCELFSAWPDHVASAWMGQSTQTARKHYLHPTPEQFAAAADWRLDDQGQSQAIKKEAALWID